MTSPTNSAALDANDYTIEQLYAILHLPETASYETIRATIAKLKSKFKKENDPHMVQFFTDIADRLFEYIDAAPIYDERQENKNFSSAADIQNWIQNQHLPSSDPTVEQNLPKRAGAFQTFSNRQIMKQKRTNVSQSYDVNVARGEINPNLVTTTERMVVIDSRLRMDIFPYEHDNPLALGSSTNFVAELHAGIRDCISIQLNSITLPKTWYNISAADGTNYFYISITNNSGTTVTKHTVPDGHYTPPQLATALSSNLTPTLPTGIQLSVSYNSSNGKMEFIFSNNTGVNISDFQFIFWDESKDFNPDGTNGNQQQVLPRIDYNLGYLMGFRKKGPISLVSGSISNTSNIKFETDAIVDLEWSKNLYIVVEDFNQNRLNSQVLTASKDKEKPRLPNYHSLDVNRTCIPGTNVPFFFTDEPGSNLTQAQIYTLNAISDDIRTINDRVIGPQTANILAAVPLEDNGTEWGKRMVIYGGNLAHNQRMFFGPVALRKLKISLLDDNGNVVNLHGRDWSFSVVMKTLYQY